MPCAPCARAVSPSASPSPRRDTHHRRDSRGSQETQDEWTEDRRSANTLMLEALHPDAHRILIPRTTMYITHQIKSRCMRHCTPRRQRTHGGGGATGADGPPSPARRQRRVCKRRAMRLAGSACCSPRRAPRPCAPLWTMTAIWPPHRATTTPLAAQRRRCGLRRRGR